ncbi:hypothetical protein ACUXAV_002104 [Cupriavidus metallidurans]|jgi:hypothetical protein|uniref:hypothetical protein n=1 Tax=Cupriavidus TaxID=106589 RepID=UPI0004933318|nr:hypothetical protein [Cupriavidus metallidurans]KWW35564.1 hypothetical protein AU374_03631 [Cupriavidus metallidurans]MDE4921703.1 hypothetical protein [Cupriavidus metallidurans]
MTSTPLREHLALLRRQGRSWIERLAELEHWLDAREADELAALQATPAHQLAAHVESLRGRLWTSMERHGALPRFTRTVAGQPIQPPAPRPHKPRGIARHLKPTPIATAGQRDLFGKGG